MSGKPAARLGDPTDCPKKGHGTNPIAAGSPDVLFDGRRPHAWATLPPVAERWPAR